MKQLIDQKKSLESTIIVGVQIKQSNDEAFKESIHELTFLVESAGGKVLGELTQSLDGIISGTYLGKGKLEELKNMAEEMAVSLVVFNDELSPAQKRNIENYLQKKVVDRTELILDIFAKRASTKEATMQVELAQLQYLYPRLTNFWMHFSRLGGGIGTRGPGETQLEVDRRLIKDKISRLKKALLQVKQVRETQRKLRKEQHLPIVSLVGYTNAGKSTLMNQLSGAGVLAEDLLFATLETVVKKVDLKSRNSFLLIDTVGFIRKLPHNLIEAFKATLEEVLLADVLLHVVDISKPDFKRDIEVVNEVLISLGAKDKKIIYVFNKADKLSYKQNLQEMVKEYKPSIITSALSNDAITILLDFLEQELAKLLYKPAKFKLPYSMFAYVDKLKQNGKISLEDYKDDLIVIEGKFPPLLIDEIENKLNHK